MTTKPSVSLLLLSTVLASLHAAHVDSELEVQSSETRGSYSPCEGDLIVDFVGRADVCLGCEVPDPLEVVSEIRPFLKASPVPGKAAQEEGLWRVSGDPQVMQGMDLILARDPRVEVAECEIRYQALGETVGTVPNDPMFGRQWNMRLVRAPEAWSESLRWGAGAIASVVDTGVSVVPDLDPKRLLPGRTFGSGNPGGRDDHGHGTHVAGTIAQSTDNGIGVAGIAGNATILPLKVLGPDGSGTNSDIAAALYEAADRGANVINLSLGGYQSSSVLRKAVLEARKAGVVIVAAAGNDNGPVNYPAADPGAFAVGAVGPLAKKAPYSSHGKQLDIAAPGGDTRGFGAAGGILQNTILEGDDSQSDYLSWQGTSMATPHVAGAVALLAAAGVTRPSEVESILTKTAVMPDLEDKEKRRAQEFYGAGVLQVDYALQFAHTKYMWERMAVLVALTLVLLTFCWGDIKGLRNRAHQLAVEAATAGTLACWMSGATGRAPLDILGEILGIAATGSPILWSALPALLLFFVAPRIWVSGFALGLAAWLLHGAVVLPCVLRGLPGGMFTDRAWLVLQGVLAFGIALMAMWTHLLPPRRQVQNK